MTAVVADVKTGLTEGLTELRFTYGPALLQRRNRRPDINSERAIARPISLSLRRFFTRRTRRRNTSGAEWLLLLTKEVHRARDYGLL
jgi:hypothetical protein